MTGYVLIGSAAARTANGQFDELGRPPMTQETTQPGVGEGSMAVPLVYEHLASYG
ncbi:MAG: hypothetical protein JO296_12040 [Pseudonocardiales bacterium]|nr:hypothetical protein [Pseudonocardiales bacterium]MBV9650856.1 hypothetical protein [Pseudonocardiales bacterium]